ncbi:MAG: isochorismatase family protein [Alphaproteobacteria bacterium]
MKIKIPASGRPKALFIIDVQPATLEDKALSTVWAIKEILRATHYPLYVAAAYHAGPESMFYKQSRWLLPQEQAGFTDEDVLAEIQHKNARLVSITKSARSGFKCDQRSALLEALEAERIAEIHIVGYDINDCVLATAYDAIDLGFYAYVIEEACGRSDGEEDIIHAALAILRQQNMTNNSNLFGCEEIEIPDISGT